MIEFLIWLFAVINYFWQGFVFMKVWNWFPAELLSVPTVGYAGALGLLLVISFFKNKNVKRQQDAKDNEEVLGLQVGLSVVTGIVLLVGFIIQAFI
ncbi:hypothetical protein AAXB25_15065 [Paenibacillus lautus]|uniref:hypothetical protein n=1 Tax=Paenibacillus lautus TaxID=1401 RepID=UPI003D2BEC3A